jgi:hypothetical protein
MANRETLPQSSPVRKLFLVILQSNLLLDYLNRSLGWDRYNIILLKELALIMGFRAVPFWRFPTGPFAGNPR